MIEVVKFKSSSYNQYLEEIGEEVECLSDEEDNKIGKLHRRISKFFMLISNTSKKHKIFHLLSNSTIFEKTIFIILCVFGFLYFENIIKLVSVIFILIFLITETIYKSLDYISKESIQKITIFLDMIAKKGKFERGCEIIEKNVQRMQMMLTKSVYPEVFSNSARLQRNLHYLEFMAKSQAIAGISGYYSWIKLVFYTISIIRDLEDFLLKLNIQEIDKSRKQESLKQTLNIQRFILDDMKILKENKEITHEVFQRLNCTLMMVDSMIDDKSLKPLTILKPVQSSKEVSNLKNNIKEDIIEKYDFTERKPEEPDDVVFIIEGQGQNEITIIEDDISFPSQCNKTFQVNLLAELKLKIQKDLK